MSSNDMVKQKCMTKTKIKYILPFLIFKAMKPVKAFYVILKELKKCELTEILLVCRFYLLGIL